MQTRTLASLAILLGACGATGASAAPPVQPTAFEFDQYYRQGDEFTVSTPAAPPAATPTVAAPAPACDDPCADDCCDDVACGDACCGGGGLLSGGVLSGLEGLSLASLLGAECTGLDIGGWTEGVYMDNNVPLSQAYNDLLSFDDVPDHFHNGQTWFYMGHTADGSGGLGLGGRVDVVYGTDAQKTQAFGNPGAGVRGFGTWDASLDHGEYGWALPQAYGEIAAGDLSVKVGHFFTLVGYEVIPVTGNFFRSHSYTMFNSEPFTHTGALGTYTVSDTLSVMGGWVLGWDTGFDQVNSGNAMHSGFTYALADDVSFSYMNTYGNFGWRDGGDDNSYAHSVVLTAALTDNLQYIAQSDVIDTSNPGVSEYDTVGLNQYLIYQINDVLSAGGRIEWWKADGVSFYGATTGVNVKLLDNLVVRPEVRQDWAPGHRPGRRQLPGRRHPDLLESERAEASPPPASRGVLAPGKREPPGGEDDPARKTMAARA